MRILVEIDLAKVIINRSCAMTKEKECQGNVDSSSSFAFSKITGPATYHANSFSPIYN